MFIEDIGLGYIVRKMAAILSWPQYVNLLWPSDTTWRHRSGSTSLR